MRRVRRQQVSDTRIQRHQPPAFTNRQIEKNRIRQLLVINEAPADLGEQFQDGEFLRPKNMVERGGAVFLQNVPLAR